MVRVLSWNLLHSLESTRVKKFHYCRPGTLSNVKRVASMLAILSDRAPDVACFQELDEQLLKMIQGGLPINFKVGSYLLNETLPSRDGCAVFYNADRFEVLESKAIRFKDVVDQYLSPLSFSARNEKSTFSLTRALHRELFEKLNHVVLIRLKERTSGRRLVACSSHLFWNPLYPDIKLLQAYLLGRIASEFSRDCEGVVVGVDLNSVPGTSGAYEVLMGSGVVDTTHPDHPVNIRSNAVNHRLSRVLESHVPRLELGSPFRSAVKEVFGNDPLYTNYTETFKGCLDYIMLGGKLKAVFSHPLPNDEELSRETALPNSLWPSDHLPLVVDLAFS
jgi:mRNA deadenylase 3'-5' endonuclease subunit Ccr4